MKRRNGVGRAPVTPRLAQRWLAISAAVAMLMASVAARAEDAKRVAILVDGSDGQEIAAGVAKHVADPYAVDDVAAFRRALSERGIRSLAGIAGNRARDARLVTRALGAMKAAHVDVAILVFNHKGRKAEPMHLWVIEAGAEKASADDDVAPNAASSVAERVDAVWAASSSFFPAPVAAPEPVPEPAPEPAPAPAVALVSSAPEPPGDLAPPPRNTDRMRPRASALFVLQASAEAGLRRFDYVDRITPQLRSYDLSAAPLFSVAGELYPLRRLRIPVVSGLGIVGDYARAVALESGEQGAQVGTSWQTYDVALREQLPVGAIALLGAEVGYGAIDFRFDQAPDAAALLPSVGYRFVRTGLDARLAFGPIAVFGGGGYLAVLSTGPIGTFFPHEHVGGIEARLGVAYTLASRIELSLSASYTRFFYTVDPVVGDANVAGGALDQMARGALSIGYML